MEEQFRHFDLAQQMDKKIKRIFSFGKP